MSEKNAFAEWWQRHAPIPNAVNAFWRMLPPNVRQVYSGVPNTIAEMSPGAAVRDLVNESGNLSRSFVGADPKGMLTAASGMALAAAGLIPGGRAAKIGKVADEAAPGIRAYHGSPHDFDKFDMAKIGTGEGAQAYGHGLYFAENEGVARSYRDALTPGKFVPQATGLTDPFTEATHAALKVPGAYSPRAWEIGHQVETALRNGDDFAHMRKFVAKSDWDAVEKQMWTAALDTAEKFRWEGGKGRMYEVRINADRDKFLDWDKPLKEQGRNVQAGANALLDPGWRKNTDWTGEHLIGPHRGVEAERRANILRESGIPGIKYLDAGSRAGGGTQNFVVFDDKIIEIMRKYGWIPGGAVAGGVLMTPPEAQAAGASQ